MGYTNSKTKSLLRISWSLTRMLKAVAWRPSVLSSFAANQVDEMTEAIEFDREELKCHQGQSHACVVNYCQYLSNMGDMPD